MTLARPARLSTRWRMLSIMVAIAVLAGLVGLYAWPRIDSAGSDSSARSCSWTADVEQANSVQAGLIRCYLKAIAQHDAGGLRSVVRASGNDGPTSFTAADYVNSSNARSGPATATVVPNASDSADATVSIRYADGAHEDREIHLAYPRSPHSWRFWDVGTYPSDQNAPAPAR